MSAGFDPRRSRWIPWAFVGFMLLVVAVNGVMAALALGTFTGVTTPRAYDRGRTYGDVLHEAARQDALGWQAEVRLADGVLRVQVRDAAGRAVEGRLDGVLQRPLTRDALVLAFAPEGRGAWAAPARAPLPGQWEARVTLFGAAGAFDIRARVVAP